jgi:hypothetical protein
MDVRQKPTGHVPGKPAALLLTGHHAQAPAVLDHSRALPQGDGRAGPAFTRRAVGSECNLIVLDARDMLDDALAVMGLRDFLPFSRFQWSRVCLPHGLSSVSTIRQASIVTNITTSCGFRTVRVGKRNSARNAAGESSRGFGVDRAAGYRFEQGRSGDRTVHLPSPPQRSQPKCSRLR